MIISALICMVCLYGLARLLHLTDTSEATTIFSNNSTFVQNILEHCPIFKESYIPTFLWGKNGHIQTIVYGKLGRVKSPFPKGKRQQHIMPDGATLTYDVFEPNVKHFSGSDITMLVCPGLANSSESTYICTFVDYAQHHGYRVVVLNHLGSLRSIKLTAPRMFTYGDTGEFQQMTENVQIAYPDAHLIAVGFSMGANIVVKYLGEHKDRQAKFLCAMSLCQGYDVNSALNLIMTWKNLRFCFVYAMTLNLKIYLRHHSDVLFGKEASKRYGQFDLKKMYASTSLVEIDECYSRRRAGFSSLQEYYSWCSSCRFIKNITIPLFMLNAYDDPIIPEELFKTPKEYANESDKAIFAVTKHGGHLGYFEGGFFIPHPVTWLDRAIIQYADAVVTVTGEMDLKSR